MCNVEGKEGLCVVVRGGCSVYYLLSLYSLCQEGWGGKGMIALCGLAGAGVVFVILGGMWYGCVCMGVCMYM